MVRVEVVFVFKDTGSRMFTLVDAEYFGRRVRELTKSVELGCFNEYFEGFVVREKK